MILSLGYLAFIEHRWVGGIFHIGRFVDLAQLDLIAGIIWWDNWRRWRRLRKIDKERSL